MDMIKVGLEDRPDRAVMGSVYRWSCYLLSGHRFLQNRLSAKVLIKCWNLQGI